MAFIYIGKLLRLQIFRTIQTLKFDKAIRIVEYNDQMMIILEDKNVIHIYEIGVRTRNLSLVDINYFAGSRV